jgi:hypothetical protein
VIIELKTKLENTELKNIIAEIINSGDRFNSGLDTDKKTGEMKDKDCIQREA